jgi:hypothetical protein
MITRISVFCKYLIICLLFFGSISLIAQTTNASKENKKHCQQKMKLFSDKIILTLNQRASYSIRNHHRPHPFQHQNDCSDSQ